MLVNAARVVPRSWQRPGPITVASDNWACRDTEIAPRSAVKLDLSKAEVPDDEQPTAKRHR
jgi:hypothetical protein